MRVLRPFFSFDRLAVLSLTVLLGVVFALPASSGKIYKWVDKDGNIHFSDTPVEEHETKGGVEEYRPDGNAISVLGAPPIAEGKKEVKEKKKPAFKGVVTMYATSWCPHCKKARAFFQANNVRYREFDIEENPAYKEKMKKINPAGGVPTIVVGGEVIKGFGEARLRELLGLNQSGS